MTNEIQQEQHRVVEELLKRQDEALDQLDILCRKVEQAITEISLTRESDDLESGQTHEQIEAATNIC